MSTVCALARPRRFRLYFATYDGSSRAMWQDITHNLQTELTGLRGAFSFAPAWAASLIVVVIAWSAILFTGRYPRGMFGFVEGVLRWEQRVIAYAFVLVTDAYPPFSLAV